MWLESRIFCRYLFKNEKNWFPLVVPAPFYIWELVGKGTKLSVLYYVEEQLFLINKVEIIDSQIARRSRNNVLTTHLFLPLVVYWYLIECQLRVVIIEMFKAASLEANLLITINFKCYILSNF